MRLFRLAALAAFVAFVVACGGGGDDGRDTAGPDLTVDLSGDVSPDVQWPDLGDVKPLDWAELAGEADAPGGDDTPEPGDVEVSDDGTPDVTDADSEPELPPGCDGAPGTPYCPCEFDGDCLSGYCIFTTEGRVCAEACVDSCKPGWLCRNVSGADPVYLCLPAQPTLCLPCATDADCGATGYEVGLLKCLDFGLDRGSFCGGPCQGAFGDCPVGFSCVERAGSMQCLPDAGECTCPGWARQSGLSTPCQRTGEMGICQGQRVCSAAGLSDCSATWPDFEKCDTIDNDCDGGIDEVADLGLSNCGVGPCFHEVPACVDGVLNECNPWQGAQPEACNAVDDDCNGQTDEGFVDTDADLVADCVDPDDDADGVPDDGNGSGNPNDKPCAGGQFAACDDNCPLDENANQADLDADGKGDACDPDKDGDGSAAVTLGGTDCDDLDPQINVGKSEGDAFGLALCNGVDDDCDGQTDEGYADLDGDGTPDCRDPDDDDDGDPDATDCAPHDAARAHGLAEDNVHPASCNGRDDDCDGQTDEGFADSDGDGTKDCVENDTDGDGDADATDCAPADPAVFHGQNEACNGTDDNCSGAADEGFADYDDDGKADCVDPDDDGDGSPDGSDCKPYDADVAPGKPELCNDVDDNCTGGVDEGFTDTDDDGSPDCLDFDDDEDGIVDAKDNCPLGPNFDQQDLDDDTLGDACDPDDDGDGVPDGQDNCPLLATADTTDTDQDGQGDACDPDDDGDGAVDGGDNCPLEANGGQEDFDGDQMGDACDPDLDGDGVLNGADTCPFVDDKVDSDGNKIPDKCELNWVGNAWPNGGDHATANNTFNMYVQVFKPGSTNGVYPNKPAPDIRVDIRYKKDGDAAWVDAVATYNVDIGNNKEYMFVVPASFLTPGGSLVVEWRPYDVTGGAGYEHLYVKGVSDKAGHWQPFTYPIW
jgi:hypothetical protein